MLRGDAKKEYQREYMRKRRSNKAKLDPVLDPVRPKKATIPGLVMQGNKIVGVEKQPSAGITLYPNPVIADEIPLYNPSIHKAGDKVLVKRNGRLVEVVIPKTDACGNIIPEYE